MHFSTTCAIYRTIALTFKEQERFCKYFSEIIQHLINISIPRRIKFRRNGIGTTDLWVNLYNSSKTHLHHVFMYSIKREARLSVSCRISVP